MCVCERERVLATYRVDHGEVLCLPIRVGEVLNEVLEHFPHYMVAEREREERERGERIGGMSGKD